MKRKRPLIQKFSHVLLYVMLYGSYNLIRILPVFTYRHIARLLGNFAYSISISKKGRERVIENMRIAFGEAKSRAEREALCRQLFIEIVWDGMEMISMSKISRRDLGRMVNVQGEEILKKVCAEGRGIVAVCAHLGSFPVMQMRLTDMGYPVYLIIREATNPYLRRLWAREMRRVGVRFVFKEDIRKTIDKAQKSLRESNILCIYLDQHAHNGVEVDFYGRKVLVPVGAAVMARKYDCTVIGLFVHRLPSGRHQVIVEGPYPMQKTDNSEDDIKVNTQLFISRVEHFVTLHPEQWFSWMHRRFR